MNDDKSKHIKTVNFDLDTELLSKRIAPSLAYSKIKKFMLKNGFTHRQYSGYISKFPMDRWAIDHFVKKMNKEFSWLKYCVQRFDVANAPNNLGFKSYFDRQVKREQELNKKQNKQLKPAKAKKQKRDDYDISM